MAMECQTRLKDALYRSCCGVNRLGDISDFVNTAGQLLQTWRGNRWMASA